MQDDPPEALREAWPLIRELLEKEALNLAKACQGPEQAGNIVLAALGLVEGVGNRLSAGAASARPPSPRVAPLSSHKPAL